MNRSTCNTCQYPLSHCLCERLFTLRHKTKIVVLQHPTERKNKKNTLKLFELVSDNIKVLVGEDFDSEQVTKHFGSNTALLFPAPNTEHLTENKTQIDTLVVIDASWKKAKKIFYINSWLQQLPTLSITSSIPKQYGIRKTNLEHGYSTLEACALALHEIEQIDCTPMFALLQHFKYQFTKKMPSKVKQRYQL